MRANEEAHYIGVDLGGTKILAGVFNSTLKLMATAKHKTKAKSGCKAVMDRMAATIEEAIELSQVDRCTVAGVVIGAPGTVDMDKGVVKDATNLGWGSVPLASEMKRRLGLPVCVDNDCNLATLGVYHVELRAKPQHMVGIFVGTGIGGGIIINGQLHRGRNFSAGEFGHMVLNEDLLDKDNPFVGSFESLAGRRALERTLRAAHKAGVKTSLGKILGDKTTGISSHHIEEALVKGDKLAIKTVREAARIISIAVGNVISILAPEQVVLGGGVVGALKKHLMPIILERAGDRVLPSNMKRVRITTSKLADVAGITGAAWLARERAQS